MATSTCSKASFIQCRLCLWMMVLWLAAPAHAQVVDALSESPAPGATATDDQPARAAQQNVAPEDGVRQGLPEAIGAQATDDAAPAPGLAAVDAIETITVTARRVEENSQDVPIPMATISGAALEAEGSFRVEALNSKLPSINVQNFNPRQTSIALRGFGNNPANDALETDVGTYFDNVYLARPGMANFDLIDIDQVFLLRGPQGTLFGKNTTAGVLNLSSRQPTFTPQGTVEWSAGSYDFRQLRASYSGPLVGESLAGRITLSQSQQDGAIKDVLDGRELNGIDREGVRGQLLYLHGDWSLRLIGDYQRDTSACCVSLLYSVGPNGGAAFNERVVAAGGSPLQYLGLRATTMNDPQSINVRQGGVSAEVNGSVSDHTLTAITAYRSWYYHPTNDADYISVAALSNAGQEVDDWQFTQELRIASPSGRSLEYVAGFYYFYQSQDNNLYTYYGPAADAFFGRPAGLLNNVFSNIHSDLVTNSVSLFAQATWHVTERLDFTGGLRGTYEEKSTRIEREAPVGGNAGTAAALAPYESGKLDRADSNPSGLISVDYKLLEGVLTYASFAHGAKSGGINPNVPPLVNGTYDTDLLSIEPQKVNDLELGIKTTLLDRRLLLNTNLFWAEARNYQAALLVPDPAASLFRQAISNVGKVRSQGVETDVQYVPAAGTHLGLSASYNDARFSSYRSGPCSAERTAADPSLRVCDLSGEDVPGAPRWVISPNARVDRAVTDRLVGYGIATYSWRSDYYGSTDVSELARIDSYGVANFRVGLQGGAGNSDWDLSAWVNNAFDKHYAQTGPGASNFGSYFVAAGAPRLYGLTLRVNF